MKRLLWGTALLLLVAGAAHAEGPVLSRCTIEWNPVTIDANGYPVTDLKEYRLHVCDIKGAHDLKTQQGPSIPAGTTTTTCQAQGIKTAGQKYLVVTAVNLSGAQSGPSNEVPFVFVAAPPSDPRGLVVR